MPSVVGSTTIWAAQTPSLSRSRLRWPPGTFWLLGDGFGDSESLTGIADTQENQYTVNYDGGDVGGDGNVAAGSGTPAAAVSTSDTLTLTFSETLDTGTYNAYIIDFGTDYTGFTARGNAQAGIDGAGTCTVDYTTINASHWLSRQRLSRVTWLPTALMAGRGHGWWCASTSWISGIGRANAGTDLIYAPSKISPGYGAALIIEYFGVVLPPVPPNPLSERRTRSISEARRPCAANFATVDALVHVRAVTVSLTVVRFSVSRPLDPALAAEANPYLTRHGRAVSGHTRLWRT